MKEVSDIALSHSRSPKTAEVHGQQSDGDKRKEDQTVPSPPRPLSRCHKTDLRFTARRS